MKIISYSGLVITSVIGMVVFDDDPRSVSIYEWILLAVLVYSAASLFRILYQLYLEENGR